MGLPDFYEWAGGQSPPLRKLKRTVPGPASINSCRCYDKSGVRSVDSRNVHRTPETGDAAATIGRRSPPLRDTEPAVIDRRTRDLPLFQSLNRKSFNPQIPATVPLPGRRRDHPLPEGEGGNWWGRRAEAGMNSCPSAGGKPRAFCVQFLGIPARRFSRLNKQPETKGTGVRIVTFRPGGWPSEQLAYRPI